ncbi:MAG: efflux RND transporter permease subunit [Gemmatimonadetes bacterium]|nr:MAG: efflux RND transporter permease subunit [Gemmatimonadota bacterium]
MNLAEFSINKKVITWTLTLVLLFAGLMTFGTLNRLEDPEFTIKNAQIITLYPGASAAEVEQEVTDLIEQATQELGQLKFVDSWSRRGVSIVRVTIKDQYDASTLPQVWDELRRKVGDYQGKLPPGAGPSLVNDDFGDVFGIYVAIYGEGYSNAQLREVAKLLRREIVPIAEVKKVVIWGAEPEVVYVEMARAKMAALEISQADIYRALSAKNLPAESGRIHVGPDYIAINPTGEFVSEQEFGDLLIRSLGGQDLVYLRDVATVRRGYQDPPRNILRFNGHPAVAIGVSTRTGGNVVTMGEEIQEKMRTLRSQIPLGMQFGVISMQSQAVVESINSFIINLIEAVIIVVVVLFLFMGLKSGFIIGAVLFLTIAGTFLVMGYEGVVLERISLGALIIALGMLVDNAIVVIDGMQVRIESGMDKVKAAIEVVGKNSTPLLGATAVAIMAFASISSSDDATGEYTRSLFTVILISLSLSWVTAMTITPLLGTMLLKPKPKKDDGGANDPYAGKAYQLYKRGLEACLRFRFVTVAVVVGLFVISMIAFGSLKQMFFPNSTRPQFYMEVYLPSGTHIRDTESTLARAEEYLLSVDGVTDVATALGGGDLRFLLTYSPVDGGSAYGAIFVSVDDWTKIDGIIPEVTATLDTLLPMATVNVKKFMLGPGEGGRVQLRISGPDRTVLREMAARSKQILREAGGQGIRDEWREKEKVIRPQLAEAQARRLGIDRPDVANVIKAAYAGIQTGVYRERDELLAIVARAPDYERTDFNLSELQIWSPAAQRMVPLGQVMTGTETVFEDATIFRRNRVTTIKIHADPKAGNLASELFARSKARIEVDLGVDVDTYFGRSSPEGVDPLAGHEAKTIPVKDADQIPLKDMPGYSIAWGGEAEDSARAQGALATAIPIFGGLMILMVILLFNAVRQPLIIFLTVPLAVIGVAWGLLLTDQPFGFMALLGFLSLTGMLIKNSIVLIEEIDGQIESGKDRFVAVVDSGVARMRPVSMAAATTILGMIPLLTDAFFISLAVTIMAGLLVATVLTLLVVPTLYVILFRIPNPESG